MMNSTEFTVLSKEEMNNTNGGKIYINPASAPLLAFLPAFSSFTDALVFAAASMKISSL